MSLKRYNPKRDDNEPDIIACLEEHGATVFPLSGSGLPDLLVGYRNRFILIEVKAGPSGKLTPAQLTFFRRAHDLPAYLVHSVEETEQLLQTLRVNQGGTDAS